MHFFRNRKKHVTGGALISSDGSAEKIAGPGCTRAAFALAPLRTIVQLLPYYRMHTSLCNISILTNKCISADDAAGQ